MHLTIPPDLAEKVYLKSVLYEKTEKPQVFFRTFPNFPEKAGRDPILKIL